MHSSGILIHVHHLETAGWDDLVWGDPVADAFGSLATVVYLLLTAPDAERISTIIIGCGPSHKDSLSEAAYTKRAMLEHFDRLHEFPRLAPLLGALSNEETVNLRIKLENITCTEELYRTRDEVRAAAAVFAERGVRTVYQVSAASHAPRCVQLQATARAEGVIPASQLWLLVPTQMCFQGAQPSDTIVLEPPHRGDDPTISHELTLAEALKPAVYMPAAAKNDLAQTIHTFVRGQTETH